MITTPAKLWKRLRQSWHHQDFTDGLPDHIRADLGLPPTVPQPRLSTLLLAGRA